MTQRLIDAAEAVIARWDSPQWNWEEPTASLIHELREAVEEAKTGTPAEERVVQLVEEHAEYVRGDKINRTHITRAAAVLLGRVRDLIG